MRTIIEEIDRCERFRLLIKQPSHDLTIRANAMAHAAAAASSSLREVHAIACLSAHGTAPSLLSDHRPEAPIYALTSPGQHCRRLAAFWGVTPVPFPFVDGETVESLIARAETTLLEIGAVAAGEHVVLTMGVPPGNVEHTNTLKLHLVAGRS